jgi:hypothetical protein
MMPPPALPDFAKYPVTVVVGVLAIAATVAWHSGISDGFAQNLQLTSKFFYSLY